MRNFKRSARAVAAEVQTKASGGVLRRVEGKNTRVRRTSEENARIIEEQAEEGRDLTRLDASTVEKIHRLWDEAAMSVTNQPRQGSRLLAAAQKIAELMVTVFTARVQKGQLKPVTRATQKAKDREGIRAGLPPLIRTGALLRSLVGKAVRR
jgi:hypothetical protein